MICWFSTVIGWIFLILAQGARHALPPCHALHRLLQKVLLQLRSGFQYLMALPPTLVVVSCWCPIIWISPPHCAVRSGSWTMDSCRQLVPQTSTSRVRADFGMVCEVEQKGRKISFDRLFTTPGWFLLIAVPPQKGNLMQSLVSFFNA